MPVTPTVFRGAQNTVDSTLNAGTALSTNVIRLMDGYEQYLSPTEVPFTSSIGVGETINQKKIEWGQSFLAPNQVTLGAAVADAVTTSIVLAAGEGAKMMLTDLIQLEDEVMWVTGIATDTLTVVRGLGSTAAAHTLLDSNSNARVIEIMSTAAQENADSPLFPIAKGATEWNLTHRTDAAIQIDNRENVTDDYEFSGTKYEKYLQKRMKEEAILFEKLAFRGRRNAESSAVVGSGTPSTMGGVLQFTDKEILMGGAPITETILMDQFQGLWDRVGSENAPSEIFVGSFMKRALSSLFNANRYSTVKDTEGTLVWNAIDTDFGRVKFTLSRYVPAGMLLMVDMSDIKKHNYKGGEMQEVLLPSNGPYKKGRLTADRTISFRGNPKRVKITGAATTSASYPNM